MQIALCHIHDELHIGSIEQHPSVCYQAEGQADVPHLSHKARIANMQKMSHFILYRLQYLANYLINSVIPTHRIKL